MSLPLQTRFLLSAAALALLGGTGNAAGAAGADLILTDARVYTVDARKPWAEAVAIRGGRIVAVGSTAEVARWKGADTRVVDLHGRLLMPAFGDAHAHPLFGGITYSRCSLQEGKSIEDYRRLIAACVARTPGKGAVYGVGWRDGYFPPKGIPSKEILDSISRDRALIFKSNGGHTLWVNSKALEIAGITKDTPDPQNGRIDRDPATGEPVGGLEEEAAMALMDPQVPPPSLEEIENALLYTARTFNAWGITSWHDADVEVRPDGTSPVLEAYRAVKDRGALTAHTVIDLKWENSRGLEQMPTLLKAAKWGRDAGLHTNSVKFFLDGVIVQKTAAMLQPYVGTAERGDLQIPEQTFKAAVQAVEDHGMQPHIHAIGDRAVRVSLDAFEAAGRRDAAKDVRPMISHMNVIDPADQPRFGKIGVNAIFQPLWACDEPYMRLAIERIGPERARNIYPANSVMKYGGRVAYGSDWPVATANPLEGMEVALTRVDPANHQNKPLLPEQRVTLEQAIRNYTLNVAYVNHMEDRTGSIEVGKSADLIVLDQDLFRIPADRIATVKVLVTLFEGKPVFGAWPTGE